MGFMISNVSMESTIGENSRERIKPLSGWSPTVEGMSNNEFRDDDGILENVPIRYISPCGSGLARSEAEAAPKKQRGEGERQL